VAVKKDECIEEVYDTTHDNKRNEHYLNSNNEYAVLRLRSENDIVVGWGKKGALAADGHYLYNTAQGSKKKIMLHQGNDAYKHEGVKAKTS
jgi:hypothetical protein